MKTKTKQTAAIYNRWLFTLGGGEQVTFAYAEALRDLGFKTTLITHKSVDISAAEKKMDVNLNNIELRYIPLQEPEQLSKYSQEYDLFINTSYLDYFPNRCKNGYLSVFFPGEIFLSPWELIKRKFLVPSLKNFFIYPTDYENFSHDTYKNKLIHKWISKESTISFSSSIIHKLSLQLYFTSLAFSTVESLVFTINGVKTQPVVKSHNHTKNTVTFYFHSSRAITHISITNPHSKKNPVALLRLTIPNIRYLLYNWFKEYFPKWEMRLHGGPSVTTLSDLLSYKEIITISEFCRYWITKYWGVKSTVLYPPVNVEAFSNTQKKKKWIAHIGRYFITGHSKKQLELIRVFRTLVDSGLLKGWEFHLIGTVHNGENHQKYYQACVSAAKGYPIHFHIGASFSELKQVLAQSSLYWHATGLDEDAEYQPIVLEHFGITTVEAMAAGCVPLVINAGGQPEIVTKGAGFVWNNRDELKKYTLMLATNEKILKTYQRNAIKRSHYFSKKQFKKRFAKIIQK